MRYVSLTVLVSLILSIYAEGGTIALWNFNDADSSTPGVAEELLVDLGFGTMTSDFLSTNIGSTTGSTVNIQSGDPAGKALLLSSKSNNGNNLTWFVNTSGFSSINISFATRRTSTGFNSNQFQYSADSGMTWTSFGAPYIPESTFGIQSFNLGGIDMLTDNSGAGFRIVLDGATSYSGNNRIDNLLVSGIPYSRPDMNPVPEPSTAALLGLGLAGAYCMRRKRFF